MIIFLYGRDSYRLKQNLEKIIAEYQKKNSGMSFSVLDFGNDVLTDTKKQLEKLSDLIKTVSFFDEKRLIVLKNAFLAGGKIADLITAWKLGADKQRILVFIENLEEKELSKKDKKLFNLLSVRPNIAKLFEPLEGRRLENWAKEEIESLDSQIKPEALRKLVSYITNPPAKDKLSDPTAIWRLEQEINKLVNYKLAVGKNSSAKNGTINVSDVELLVGFNINLNIFEVIDAIANKSKYRAAATLYNHLETGVDSYYIFSMLVYQFRNLLRVKSLIKNAVPYANVIKKTGLNPFVAKKVYEQCKKFDLDELKQLFSKLAQIEIDSKQGKIDMADGLYKFIFSLT